MSQKSQTFHKYRCVLQEHNVDTISPVDIMKEQISGRKYYDSRIQELKTSLRNLSNSRTMINLLEKQGGLLFRTFGFWHQRRK